MECNSQIYQAALGHLTIAELAESKAIEIDQFYFAYKANLAFAIELFLKALEATSEERVFLEVGEAELTRLYSESSIRTRGHNLREMFNKLSSSKKVVLNEKFSNSRCNVSSRALEEVLLDLGESFVENRYAFESGNITSSEPELLLWTARFFKETLNEPAL